MPQSEVTLGSVTIPVYPQRHAYLANRIGPTLQTILARGEGLTAETLLGFAQDGSYDLLVALIPNLKKSLPAYKFHGFASQEAYDAGEYDPEADDSSPTIPEISEAITTALKVNGIDELVNLGKGLIDTRLLKAVATAAIADSISSPSLPSPSGESDLTSSGASSPTSTESEDSQSPASTA